MNQLRNTRTFKNSIYLDQMFFCHSLDYKRRDPSIWVNEKKAILSNPYRNLSNDL